MGAWHLKRYGMSDLLCEQPEGDYVLYADANAEAADLSADIATRDARILELEHDLDVARAGEEGACARRDYEMAENERLEARIRELEGLARRHQDQIDEYLKTRGTMSEISDTVLEMLRDADFHGVVGRMAVELLNRRREADYPAVVVVDRKLEDAYASNRLMMRDIAELQATLKALRANHAEAIDERDRALADVTRLRTGIVALFNGSGYGDPQ